jgi:RPA family protein
MDREFKRNTAYKIKIGDLFLGKIISDNDKFSFLELGDKKILRVNIIGNIIDKYESQGERKYSFFTIDDGSGQIKIKCFGEDVDKFNKYFQGQTILVIGFLRQFNNELYISPEIMRELDTRYLLIRKLELENQQESQMQNVTKTESIAIKDKILNLIKESEIDNGIDLDEIIIKLKEIPSNLINQEIKFLLEEGIIFEPRPGRLRWLG